MEKKSIELKPWERKALEQFSTKGVQSVRLVNRAKIILALDCSGGRKPETQESIATRVGVCRRTVNTAKQDFLAAPCMSAFLRRKHRETPPVPAKVTGEVEAHIIALACSTAPPGCARWTLQLLAQKCVELQYIDSISAMTVQRVLKKRRLNPI